MSTGKLNPADRIEGPTPANRFAPQLAVSLAFGGVGSAPVSRHLLVAYTEEYAIQLMHQYLRPYWQRNNKPTSAMLDEAEQDYAGLEPRGSAFDREFIADLARVGGEHYAWLATFSYRQAIAAHMLVADADGNLMLFSKENFSNGDIATMDVLYPLRHCSCFSIQSCSKRKYLQCWNTRQCMIVGTSILRRMI